MTRIRSLGWLKDDALGVEWADVTLHSDRIDASIVAVGGVPVPYRLDATLETGAGWVTRRLRVATRGAGWRRTLDLARDDAGRWTVATEADGDPPLPDPGGPADALADALDCDLGLSPVTNTMPMLREGLLDRDGDARFLMAWVDVPSLRVVPSPQAYATRGRDRDGHRLIEYRSLDGPFRAVLSFDADGLVVDYPMLARRLPAATGADPTGRPGPSQS